MFDLECVRVRAVSVVEPPHVRILGQFLEHTETMGTGSTLWRARIALKVSLLGESLGLDYAFLPWIQDLIRAGLLMDARNERDVVKKTQRVRTVTGSHGSGRATVCQATDRGPHRLQRVGFPLDPILKTKAGQRLNDSGLQFL